MGDMERSEWSDHTPGWPTRTLEDVLEDHLEPLGASVLYKLPLSKENTSRPYRSASRRRRTETVPTLTNEPRLTAGGEERQT